MRPKQDHRACELFYKYSTFIFITQSRILCRHAVELQSEESLRSEIPLRALKEVIHVLIGTIESAKSQGLGRCESANY